MQGTPPFRPLRPFLRPFFNEGDQMFRQPGLRPFQPPNRLTPTTTVEEPSPPGASPPTPPAAAPTTLTSAAPPTLTTPSDSIPSPPPTLVSSVNMDSIASTIICPFVYKDNYYLSTNATAVPFRSISLGWKAWCEKENLSTSECQSTSTILTGLGNNNYSLQGCIGIALESSQFIWLCHDAVYKQMAAGPIGSTAIPQLCMNFGNFRDHCPNPYNAELILNQSNRKGFGPYLHGCVSDANHQQCSWIVPISLSTAPITLDSLASYRTCATHPFSLSSLSTGSSSLFTINEESKVNNGSSTASGVDAQTLSLTIAGSVFAVLLVVSGFLFYRKKKRDPTPTKIESATPSTTHPSPSLPTTVRTVATAASNVPPRLAQTPPTPVAPKPVPMPMPVTAPAPFRASLFPPLASPAMSHVSSLSNDMKPTFNGPPLVLPTLLPPRVAASPPVLPVLQRSSLASTIQVPASQRRTVLADGLVYNGNDDTIKNNNLHF